MTNPLLITLAAAAGRSLADAPDADLLGRVAAGRDDAAFAELVRRYGPLVWRTARVALEAGPDAEDVFQATFLALARHIRSIRRPDALPGWLHRTARRLAARVRRRNGKALPVPAAPTAADPLDRLTARELLAAVDAGLAALPEAYRVPLLLCGVDGLSQDEAAKRLGWSAGSVRGRLERGRKRLRAWLEARGLAVPAALGGVVVVPAELTAAVIAARGGPGSPAVAKLAAEATGMSISLWWKSVAAAAVCAAGLGITVVAGPPGDKQPDPKPNPIAQPDGPKAEPLIAWSAPYSESEEFKSGVWSPDGKHVLTAGWATPARTGEVRVWDAATGKVVHAFRGASHGYGWLAGGLAISPDGRAVAACGTQGRGQLAPLRIVEVWDWGYQTPRLKLDDLADSPITDVTISPDGKTLAAVNMVTRVQMWNLVTGKAEWGQRPSGSASHQYKSSAIAFDPTGRVLAIDRSSRFAFYDAKTFKPRGEDEVSERTVNISSLAFSPDGKRVAVGTQTTGVSGNAISAGVVAVSVPAASDVTWSGFRPFRYARADGDTVFKVAFSPDGRYVVAGCSSGSVRVFDATTGELRAEAKEHTKAVSTVSFSPDGKQLLSVGRDAVKVWSVAELMTQKLK